MVRRLFTIFMIVLVFGSLFPVVAQSEPAITITPDPLTFNDQVTIEGNGFPANTDIAIYLGLPESEFWGDPLSTITSDAGGEFSTSFEMPGVWPGEEDSTTPVPLTGSDFVFVATTEDNAVRAVEPFTYEMPSLDEMNWQHYVNNNIGFQIMLPPDWAVQDFGTSLEVYTVPGDPGSAALRIGLTPVEVIEGGILDGTPVAELSLEDYASIAVQYELGGPGTFVLQSVQPVETFAGETGFRADWVFERGSAGDNSTPDAENNQSIPFSAAYFDLPQTEILGQTYRALEILSGNNITPALFDTIIRSVVLDGVAEDAAFFEGLEVAANLYLDRQEATVSEVTIQPQVVIGDYVRFTVGRTDDADGDVALGFAQRVGDTWEIIDIGTGFTPEYFTENRLPSALQPPQIG